MLCASFWFLGLLLWVRYTEKPGPVRYGISLLAFAFGLMSKPMIVTVPVLLLLLDIWPLRRPFSRPVLLEKLGPVVLAVLGSAGILTTHSGAMIALTEYPLSFRFQNSLVSLVEHLRSSFWPDKLSIAYPIPANISYSSTLVAFAILAAMTGSCLVYRRRMPWLIVGWAWFLVTIFPVIGLIQISIGARWDQYMYVPLVGIAIMVAWAAADLASRVPQTRWLVTLGGLLACGALAASASVQLRYWRSAEPLYRHAIETIPNNHQAWYYLAHYLAAQPGRAEEALAAAREASRLRPDLHQLHTNVAMLARQLGHSGEALSEAEAAIRLAPAEVEPLVIAASALRDDGRPQEARSHVDRALALDPNNATAHDLLAQLLIDAGSVNEAIPNLEAAIRSDPADGLAEGLLGVVLFRQGHLEDALPHLEKGASLQSGQWQVEFCVGTILSTNPLRQVDAISHMEASIRAKSDNAAAHRNLAILQLRNPELAAQAIPHLREALRLEPDPNVRRILDQLERRQPAR